MLVIVCATRVVQEAFPLRTRLGRCLARLGEFTPMNLRLFHSNHKALGSCYNLAIEQAQEDDTLVFVQDDVHIDDWMLGWRLGEALERFDVVGILGNRRHQAGQCTWLQQPPDPADSDPVSAPLDSPYLSGAIVHAPHGPGAKTRVTYYGASPAEVHLLDGVMLAARASRLQAAGVRFDPDMGFHFYDLDFCRSAKAAGLKLGTWPIAVSHASPGDVVRSQSWEQSRDQYFKKWQS